MPFIWLNAVSMYETLNTIIQGKDLGYLDESDGTDGLERYVCLDAFYIPH